RNIAVMTNSGALRNLIAEAAERTGAQLAPLLPATLGALRAALDQDDITNPLDSKRTIPTAQYVACLDALMRAAEVDIVLAAEELPLQEGAERRVANLRTLEGAAQRAAAAGKTLAAFTPLLVSKTDYGRTVRAQVPHVPILRETERALRVMRALAEAGCRPAQAGGFFAPPADTHIARTCRARQGPCASDCARRGRVQTPAARLWHHATGRARCQDHRRGGRSRGSGGVSGCAQSGRG